MIMPSLRSFSSILDNGKLIAELITPFKKFNSLALNTSNNFITPGIAKTQAAFSIQIVFPFVQFITFAICAPIFEEAAFRTTIYRFFKNDKIAYIVSCVGFAWMHTGPNPILIVYLPMSIVLTSIYHRRRVLGESILVHGVFNALLPIVIPLLQVITGLYYL